MFCTEIALNGCFAVIEIWFEAYVKFYKITGLGSRFLGNQNRRRKILRMLSAITSIDPVFETVA